MSADELLSIDDLAFRLRRAPHTIRQWLKREDFPESARPQKEGGRGKLVWTPDQLDEIKAYANERDAARGWPGSAAASA